MQYRTYNRDGFTGLDYADQRFYASSYGRFNTPDPYMGSVGPTDPGSWNRYVYVKGDPINHSDRRGLADDDDCDWDPDTNTLRCPSGGDGAGGGGDLPPIDTGHGSGEPPGSGGGGNPAGNSSPTAVKNVKPLAWALSGALASALDNTDCGKWYQAGLTTSGYGATPGQSLGDFLVNTIPQFTGAGNFVGGNASAVTSNTLAPGYLILVDNGGAFFNPLPKGTSIGYSDDYADQFAAIHGGSQQAQVFLVLHELGHLFGMTRSDSGSTANQAFNNDEIWLNCSHQIQGFSN